MNENVSPQIVTRIPPSPTGWIHVGTVRTALYNYLFARKHGGKFILRIEDTDRERSKKEYEQDIYDSLSWLGFEYDGPVLRQSERNEAYKPHLEKLVNSGKAYVSKEEPKEAGQRSEVIRFRNPNAVIEFDDLIRGKISIDTTDLGDFVIAKSFDEPVYHFAVVVDDGESGVTHVIRGEDHISNTPRQILILEALGFARPTYGHMPLILAPDRSKLSKRKHGESVSLKYYIEKGYLREAIINYMALLGWNPGTDQEIFTLQELISAFDITKVQKGGAIFSIEKLNWFNKEHMKRLLKEEIEAGIRRAFESSEEFKKKGWSLSDDFLKKIAPVVFERINVYSDVGEMIAGGEFDYYFADPNPEASKLRWKDDSPENAAVHIQHVIDTVSNIVEGEWTAESIKSALWPYAEKAGKGNVLWPTRFALSGREKSPDPFVLMAILGQEATIRRLNAALAKLR